MLNLRRFLAKPLWILRRAVKDRGCFEWLKLPGRCRLSGLRQQRIEFLTAKPDA
jgi:hypothetical protein